MGPETPSDSKFKNFILHALTGCPVKRKSGDASLEIVQTTSNNMSNAKSNWSNQENHSHANSFSCIGTKEAQHSQKPLEPVKNHWGFFFHLRSSSSHWPRPPSLSERFESRPEACRGAGLPSVHSSLFLSVPNCSHPVTPLRRHWVALSLPEKRSGRIPC